MLTHTRKSSESVVIDGGRVVVTVLGIVGRKVQLGFEAPRDVPIDRKEIHDAKAATRKAA
jgi:carbon storage regulator CsrA